MSQEVSPGDSGAEALRRPPRPFRMRGWYRALKRGEEWAVIAFKQKDSQPMVFYLHFTYGPQLDRMQQIAYDKNPILDSLKTSWDENSRGGYFPVPLCYEDKSE